MSVRQSKYLNNLIELDHRNIKRRVRPMLGFKSFRRVQTILPGIELPLTDFGLRSLRTNNGLSF